LKNISHNLNVKFLGVRKIAKNDD